jgi:hypothetical protein
MPSRKKVKEVSKGFYLSPDGRFLASTVDGGFLRVVQKYSPNHIFLLDIGYDAPDLLALLKHIYEIPTEPTY